MPAAASHGGAAGHQGIGGAVMNDSIPPFDDLTNDDLDDEVERLDEAERHRVHLLLSAWLTREVPLRDYLLGKVFCTTSRWLIFGDNGSWEDSPRAVDCRRQRMQLVADEFGGDLMLWGYNRDALPSYAMPPPPILKLAGSSCGPFRRSTSSSATATCPKPRRAKGAGISTK